PGVLEIADDAGNQRADIGDRIDRVHEAAGRSSRAAASPAARGDAARHSARSAARRDRGTARAEDGPEGARKPTAAGELDDYVVQRAHQGAQAIVDELVDVLHHSGSRISKAMFRKPL